MEISLIKEIVSILALSAISILICRKINLPSIIAFFLVGIISGPFCLKLISDFGSVDMLSELGIMLLLFTLGIEFSFENFSRIKKVIFIGAPLQFFLTSFVFFIFLYIFKIPLIKALFFASLISLSSTAIVMKLLQQELQIDSPHGKTALGMLIFQDIIAIFIMFLMPVFASSKDFSSFLFPFLKALILIISVLFIAIAIVPRLLSVIVKYRCPELFILTIILICLSVGYISSSLGLSLGLGAFLAGLAISESEYHNQALSLIIPFRDIFLSFFFISVGMLLNINFIISNFFIISFFVFMVMLIKTLIIFLICIFLKLPLRNALLTSLFICQIGEFSFVLLKEGLRLSILNQNDYQMFLSVSVISMALTPLIIYFAYKFSDYIVKNSLFQKLDLLEFNSTNIQVKADLKDHIVIIGFGLSGKAIAKTAKLLNRPYLIIESNSETVSKEKANNENIFFGDASNLLLLKSLKVQDAELVIITVSDSTAISIILSTIRCLNTKVKIIVRSRFLSETKIFKEMGADEVICKESTATIKLLEYLFKEYDVSAIIKEKILLEFA